VSEIGNSETQEMFVHAHCNAGTPSPLEGVTQSDDTVDLHLTSAVTVANDQVRGVVVQTLRSDTWGSRGRRFKSGQPDMTTQFKERLHSQPGVEK
jgi:hypothetical protein